MASSNRHWPSMFKSKPCNNHQWQHLDHNPNSILSTSCHRPPYTSGPVCEERSPEPKPRWNPKPEQIRILEAIFNSGMINPPRDEICKIRARLQEYGQVGDANVYYWFQNRKSRSKNKLRHPKKPTTPPPSTPSSSSSSSENSSPKIISMEMTNSPSPSVNKNNSTYFPAPALVPELLAEPYLYPEGGFSFAPSGTHAPVDGNLLLGELLMMNNNYNNINSGDTKKNEFNGHEKVYTTSTVDGTAVSSVATTTTTVSSTISHFLGVGVGDSHPAGQTKLTVFINDVAFEVSVGPFDVHKAFGNDAVLIQSNGQPVFTNEWGVTVQSLQHGGVYYLMRLASPTVSESQ